MPKRPFQHLPLPVPGRFRAKFQRNAQNNPQVKENLANRDAHATTIRQSLTDLRSNVEAVRRRWVEKGLPAVSAGAGFLMQIPEGSDADQIAHALGVELVAETEGGYLLAATQDLSFRRLEEVLTKFEKEDRGGAMAASLLEVFGDPGDRHRIERVLDADVLPDWPFNNEQEYIFDVSIQSAESTRSVPVPRVSRKAAESDKDYQRRREDARVIALAEADTVWTDHADLCLAELKDIVAHYGGRMLGEWNASSHSESEDVIRFPDSFQMRARVRGEGWRDIIIHFTKIFEVSWPDHIDQPLPPSGVADEDEKPDILAPPESAPAVCIIDSGIQEGHLWLESAIDSTSSRCFIPGLDANAVNDDVLNGGHGTRVAGAVLFPVEIPRHGSVQAPFWLQNAKVLAANKELPEDLPPAKYIGDVVHHFSNTSKRTRIFNHSIATNRPCPLRRMTAWATRIDDLSHRNDVLFIQAAGNILGEGGAYNNPRVLDHLRAGRDYPDYLKEPAARIANPAQSLNALTVGSVAGDVWEGSDRKSFATERLGPSAFSRSGFGIWHTIKPEVVEIGGDYARLKEDMAAPTIEPSTAVELLRAAGDGGPAFASDDVGTSYSAPKVAHLAARLQDMLPDASSLLYRGLIVHSARWPGWVEESGWSSDQALRLLGFGLPDMERATTNAQHRITLITEAADELHNQGLHFYRIQIPAALRALTQDPMLRIDVTLSYSSEPRRTRSSRRGYLATWLDWRASGIGQPMEEFQAAMVSGEQAPTRKWKQMPWLLHFMPQHGDAKLTQRGNGTVQKDWASIAAHDLPEEFCIAVRGHKGWDHREGSGGAKYCLIVSVEAKDLLVPVYETMSAVNVEIRGDIESFAHLLE